MKKIKLLSCMIPLLSILSSCVDLNNNSNQIIEENNKAYNIELVRLSSITNIDGSLTQTFSYEITPTLTIDNVKVNAKYFDGTSCKDVVNILLDEENKTITVTCLKPFSKQIILTAYSSSNEDINAKATIDYLQRWPIANQRVDDDDLYDYPFMIGNEFNNDEVNYFPNDKVDFLSLFDIDYGVYSKASTYYYAGISSDGNLTGKVVDFSNTFTTDVKNQMISEAWKLINKMHDENLSWSKELIYNLVDSNTYKDQLFESMDSYEYEDCGSYIELIYTDFSLLFSNSKDEKVIGTLDKVKFRINITADYSSLHK